MVHCRCELIHQHIAHSAVPDIAATEAHHKLSKLNIPARRKMTVPGRLERNLSYALLLPVCPMESSMPDNNNKNPNEKQPGEKPEGTYHFNPGNMAGKKPGDAEQTDKNRGAPPELKEKPTG
jgi:hypothetical protein